MTLEGAKQHFYLRATFGCKVCGVQSAKVFAGSDYCLLVEQIAKCTCEVCKRLKGGELDVLSVVELPIQHLEEFMVWA